MVSHAVGHCFDHHGSGLREGKVSGGEGRVVDGENVVAVDADGGNSVAVGAGGDAVASILVFRWG